MKSKKNKDKIYNLLAIIVFSAIVLIIIIRTFIQYQDDQEIKRYRGTTEAIIIDFKHINLTRYSIFYEYQVGNKKYIGITGVEWFKCDDGKLGCVVNTFKLSYSSTNPSNSTILMGKYEKHKRTVEF